LKHGSGVLQSGATLNLTAKNGDDLKKRASIVKEEPHSAEIQQGTKDWSAGKANQNTKILMNSRKGREASPQKIGRETGRGEKVDPGTNRGSKHEGKADLKQTSVNSD